VTPLAALLGLCLTAVTLCYALLCAASPWGRCARCRGTGGRRHCPPCHGTGLRPRLGRQALTHLRRLHHDGTRPAPQEGHHR